MTIRERARARAARANEGSKWRTYSRRKRLWAATGLSVYSTVGFALATWLVGRAVDDVLGLGVAMGVGNVCFIAMVWTLAVLPDRAPGWWVVWGAPLITVTVVVATATTEAIR
jgi:hypothetical protein